MVNKLAVIVVNRDTDIKVSVMVNLIGDKFSYEASFKSDKEFLTPDGVSLDTCFELAKTRMKEVLSGKYKLNAIV